MKVETALCAKTLVQT